MKAERRHTLQTNTLATKIVALPDIGKKYGKRALVIIVVLALVVLLILRWRRNTAEARQRVSLDLASAQNVIDTFTDSSPYAQFPGNLPPGDAAAQRARLADVLKDASDAADKARALILSGDLDWRMGHYPRDATPQATTQPRLNPDKTPEECLKSARDNYQEVLKSYPDQAIPCAQAHFGLAAIAEDEAGAEAGKAERFSGGGKADWGAARQQYEAILDNKAVPAALKELARARLERLATLAKAPLIGRPVAAAATPTLTPTMTPAIPSLKGAARGRPSAVVPPMIAAPTPEPAGTARPAPAVGAGEAGRAGSATAASTRASSGPAVAPPMNAANHPQQVSTTSVATPEGRPTSGPAGGRPAGAATSTRASTGPAVAPPMNAANHPQQVSTTSVATPEGRPTSGPVRSPAIDAATHPAR